MNVADDIPGIICHNHVDKHIAWENLALHFTLFVVLDLDNLFGRNHDAGDQIVQLAVFHCVFNIRCYFVLIAGIGMHNIPLWSFRHKVIPPMV